MNETHTQYRLWIANEDIERLKALALENGWVNTIGRESGKPSIKMALDALEKTTDD